MNTGLRKSARTRSGPVITWLRLARVFQRLDRASMELQRQHGLTVAQFDVLAHLGVAEGSTQQELADALLVTKGNVCQLLDRLEARGLVRRTHEGRTNYLSLTDEGKGLYGRAVSDQEALIEREFASLTEGERRDLQRLLRKLERGAARKSSKAVAG